jgi:hypothetical protein
VQIPPPPPNPSAPTAGPITSEPRSRDSAGSSAFRIALVVAAIWLLVLARDRFVDFERRVQIAFDIDEARWLLGVLVAIVAGVAFGLALVLPARRRGYRTADALVLGAVPFLYLVGAFLVLERFARGWNLPSFVDRALFHLGGLFSFEVTFAVSVLLGVAVAFGVRGRDAPSTAPVAGTAWS